MPCGLFGKLPAKRDFIAVNTPREFLLVWEEWLQGGVSASKINLGTGWLKAYLTAPLWRFWLGPGICGMPVTGVFMPSVDGVGRHFPLTVLAVGEAGDALALPTEAGSAAWYDLAEDFALKALEPDVAYDGLLAELELLALPARSPAPEADGRVADLYRASTLRAEGVDQLPDAFIALEAEAQRRAMLSKSYWWTIGGEDFAPAALVATGLPDPHMVTAMLSGDFTVKTPAEI